MPQEEQYMEIDRDHDEPDFPWKLNDLVDVLDSTGHWCEAEILKYDRHHSKLLITYVYWSSQWDEWIGDHSRIAKLNAHTYFEGGPFKIGQRIEALDTKQKWLEAFVIDLNDLQVKVHYFQFSAKFDEWVDRKDQRLRPYGRDKSTARKRARQWKVPAPGDGSQRGESHTEIVHNTQNIHGNHSNEAAVANYTVDDGEDRNISFRNNNFNNNNINNNNTNSTCTCAHQNNSCDDGRTRQVAAISEHYAHYMHALGRHGLQIFSVPGDGNCLFRSVAHQVYGDHELHALVREKCMDYMAQDAEFFSQFVQGGMETFHLYIAAKRQNACWGDDPEIQAMCEMYFRPAQIWGYDNSQGARTLNTFHDAANSGGGAPIRLSYYGGGHYDSIVDGMFERHLARAMPGQLEDLAIERVRCRQMSRPGTATAAAGSSARGGARTGSGVPDHRALDEGSAELSQARRETDIAATESQTLELAVQLSRKEHLVWAEQDLDAALAMSLSQSPSRSHTASALPAAWSSDSSSCPETGELCTASAQAQLHGTGQAGEGDMTVPADLVALQSNILQSVAEQSEREFLDRAILLSMEQGNADEDEDDALVQLAKQESQTSLLLSPGGQAAGASYSAGGLTDDPELAMAMQLSALSEEEVLQLALQQSMRLPTFSNSSNSNCSISNNNNHNNNAASYLGAGAVAGGSGSDSTAAAMLGAAEQEEEDRLLQAALQESLQSTASTSCFNDGNNMIDDDDAYEDDEEMRRAIMASLQR